MLAVSLCGTSIESIESMISIESVDSIESIESRESIESIEFSARGLPKKYFLSARTSNKRVFERADLPKKRF